MEIYYVGIITIFSKLKIKAYGLISRRLLLEKRKYDYISEVLS